MAQKSSSFFMVVALMLIAGANAWAEDFYKGKTIRIIVGFSAGGGFDTYARAISRHMGKHIPDEPTIVVENMTGAGSLIAANHVFKVAKPDGLTSVTWRKALDSGDAIPVLQANRRTHPDLPQVPQAIKLAKSEEGRRLIEVGIHGDSDIVRTYTLPPGTPKERVQLLRKAFEATLTDSEFVADAQKSKLNIGPVTAEAIEKDIASLFKLDPTLLGKLKEILYN